MKIWLTLFLASFFALSSYANMANPMRFGDRMGEPSGELRKLHIKKELLTLDLRPAATSEPASIEAKYFIVNDSSERTVELVFVGVNIERGNYDVRFDGTPVQTFVVSDSSLPEEWRVPDSLLAFSQSDRKIAKEANQALNVLRFSITISQGEHTISVRYRAALRYHVARLPVKTWYADYILAPAKQWASFGSLETNVYLPEGWEAESTPGMIRNGDTLTGVWDIIPNNVMTVTLHAPITFALGFADTGIPILVLLLCAVFLVRTGIKLGKKYTAGTMTILGALFRACAVTVLIPIVLFIVMGFIRSWLLSSFAGGQAASGYDYGILFGLAVMMPLIILASLILIAFSGTATHVMLRRKILKAGE